MTTLPFQHVNGTPLNGEQRSYLEGLFAGLARSGVRFSDVEPNPVEAPVPTAAPAPAKLIYEERLKRELHPLDAWEVLREHAAANRAPERENIFRFKWQGLFYLAPQKDAFMARLRIPGGQLRTFQLRELARVASELTTGYVQVTTRANLQLRLIQPRHAADLIQRIQSVGLHTRGAGADNIRNLTCNPTAGIDPHELIDTLPLVHELGQVILSGREFYDLPRKFNVAFDGGGLIGSLEDTNDIGLKAVRVTAGPAGIPAGVYFRVALGGATGHKAFASDLGVLVRPEEAVKVTAALIRVYIAHGNRADRKRARLKHLLETWSLAQYLEATEKLLGYALARLGPEVKIETPAGLPAAPHSHIGVYPQRQPGLHYVGVAMPVGQITPRQMLRLADLADHYGSGEVRLTVWQNLIVPNVPAAYVETVKKALVKMGLDWRQSHVRGGLVACTGNSYCKFASANTKGHALQLAAHVEKHVPLDQPVNIHLTGCPNSCAQHYIGDIGLLGTKAKVGGESVEGYHVFVGGGFGDRAAVGRQVFQALSFEDTKATVTRMLQAYLRHRAAGESFQQFVTRHDLNQLQVLFSPSA